MSEKKTPEYETIRLLFELDRADDPQLYDDLIRFKKRVGRDSCEILEKLC